jgi:hypothetical protein
MVDPYGEPPPVSIPAFMITKIWGYPLLCPRNLLEYRKNEAYLNCIAGYKSHCIPTFGGVGEYP